MSTEANLNATEGDGKTPPPVTMQPMASTAIAPKDPKLVLLAQPVARFVLVLKAVLFAAGAEEKDRDRLIGMEPMFAIQQFGIEVLHDLMANIDKARDHFGSICAQKD